MSDLGRNFLFLVYLLALRSHAYVTKEGFVSKHSLRECLGCVLCVYRILQFNNLPILVMRTISIQLSKFYPKLPYAVFGTNRFYLPRVASDATKAGRRHEAFAQARSGIPAQERWSRQYSHAKKEVNHDLGWQMTLPLLAKGEPRVSPGPRDRTLRVPTDSKHPCCILAPAKPHLG